MIFIFTHFHRPTYNSIVLSSPFHCCLIPVTIPPIALSFVLSLLAHWNSHFHPFGILLFHRGSCIHFSVNPIKLNLSKYSQTSASLELSPATFQNIICSSPFSVSPYIPPSLRSPPIHYFLYYTPFPIDLLSPHS